MNPQNKVSKLISSQRNNPDPSKVWKQTELILKSKELLSEGHYSKALQSFRNAYDNNPDHYYLAQYIQSLEFTQSPDFENYKLVFERFSRTYDGLNLYGSGNYFFYKDENGYIYELYPLTKNSFMLPTRIDTRVFVEHEEGEVSGLNFVFPDGLERFHQRIN